MKKLNYVLLLSIMFMLIAGCSKDESPGDPLNPNDDGVLKSPSAYIPGTDITVQLRNDLNAGLDVTLPAGHFYVSETIIVIGYSGTVKGAGKDVTIIETAEGYQATPDPMFPYPGVELTEIFAIYWSKGDVSFKNMTILVPGDSPAEEHNNPFFGPSTTIDNVIVVSGVDAEAENGITVTFKNLKIMGDLSNDPLSHNGFNMAWPLIATAIGGEPKPVSLDIKNCEVQYSGEAAIQYMDVHGGHGDIMNNEISNCFEGISMELYYDPLNVLGEVIVKNNDLNNITGDAIINTNTWYYYCIKNNTLDGEPLDDDCQ